KMSHAHSEDEMRSFEACSWGSSSKSSPSSSRTRVSSPQSKGLLGGGAGWYGAITLNIFARPPRRGPVREGGLPTRRGSAGELARHCLVVGREHDPERRRDLVVAPIREVELLGVPHPVVDVA